MAGGRRVPEGGEVTADELTVICAWCERLIRGWLDVKGKPKPPVSHGCCKACAEKVRKQWEAERP